MKCCCVLQDHYDDERDKTVFHNTTSDLQDQDQDQDHSVQDQDRFFWSQTGLVLRPTVSDHITGAHIRDVKWIVLCHVVSHWSLTLCAKFDWILSATFKLQQQKLWLTFCRHGIWFQCCHSFKEIQFVKTAWNGYERLTWPHKFCSYCICSMSILFLTFWIFACSICHFEELVRLPQACLYVKHYTGSLWTKYSWHAGHIIWH